METFKMICVATAYDTLQTKIFRIERRLQIVQQTIAALAKLQGKTLTARIATQVSKEVRNVTFVFSKSYSWYELEITGDGFDRISLNLGYFGSGFENVVDMEAIKQNNQSYLLDEERLPKYRAKLNTIVDDVGRYNKALLEVIAAENNLEPVKFALTDNNKIRVETFDGRIVQ